MSRKRVLFAGGGDLSRRSAASLLAAGDRVWALRRRPPAEDPSGISWLAGDLSRPETLAGLPSFTHVVYAPAPDERSPENYRAVFIDGLCNLGKALDRASLQRFIFISSSAVYGDHGDEWVDEQTPANPAGFNGEILLEAENWLVREIEGAVLVRLAGLYGPQRTGLLSRLRAGRATLPAGRSPWANRFHIDDAARAVAHLLELKLAQRCYIGADDHPYRLDELYDALADTLGVPRPARTGREGSRVGKRLCNARLRASGFEPEWPDAIDAYRSIIDDSVI